ncbi:MAG: hypothetical protein ACJA2S_001804, partial [Cyclobacteriaceae bacterium]
NFKNYILNYEYLLSSLGAVYLIVESDSIIKIS